MPEPDASLPSGPTMLVLLVVVGLFGYVTTVGAYETWRGVVHTQHTEPVPGTIHELSCADSCTGTFRPDDGSRPVADVRVEGGAHEGTPGEFVPGIDTGPVVGGVASVDSFYVDGWHEPTMVGYVLLALLLSGLAALLDLLTLAGLLTLTLRR